MQVRFKSFMLSCAATLLLTQLSSIAEAQPRYASKERSHSAVAHYARARAMCVETLEEFEAGRSFARPDLMLDAEEWRLTMVSLCEKLNRLVDPKIRISSQGVQVASNPRMVRRAKDRLPAVVDGPEPRNDVGEEKRLLDKQEARARMFAPSARAAVPTRPAVEPQIETEEAPVAVEEPAVVEEEPAAVEEEIAMEEEAIPTEEPTEEELLEQALQEATAIAEQDEEDTARNAGQEDLEIDSAPEGAVYEDEIEPQTEVAEIPSADAEPPLEEAPADEPVDAASQGEISEDEQIAVAIEEAIKSKLRNLDEGGEAEEELE